MFFGWVITAQSQTEHAQLLQKTIHVKQVQLKKVDKEKVQTQQQLQQQVQHESELQKQIDDLNKQLQAKKEAQTLAEQTQVVVPAPIPQISQTSLGYQPSSGGCQTYWSGDYYLDNIIRFESGGNSCATNPGGCFGLLQACPGDPLKFACGGDPTCQIAWFQANKTDGRSWAQVWQHELAYGWW